MAIFERVTVIGLGLLGGSLALALRERGLAKEIIGVSRVDETWRRALAQGVVDRGTTDPADGVAGAEFVVLASPVDVMAALVKRAAKAFGAGCLLTDVGSVKGPLAESLPPLLPEGVEYLGSHPMAGSHETGLKHARADLFSGAVCVLTPTQDSSAEALLRLRTVWGALGMRLEERSPELHDREVAWVSHAPHAAAFAFAEALSDAPESAAKLRGTGFRDFVRIARSDPDLWAGILAENADSTGEVVERVVSSLKEVSRLLSQGDREGLSRWIAKGRDAIENGD